MSRVTTQIPRLLFASTTSVCLFGPIPSIAAPKICATAFHSRVLRSSTMVKDLPSAPLQAPSLSNHDHSYPTTPAPDQAQTSTRTSSQLQPVQEDDPIIQYIVIRRDLSWPIGSVIAQAVHASIAAVWDSRHSSVTQSYCDQPGNFDSSPNVAKPQMHTVVLDANSENDLFRLATRLDDNNIGYVLWRERPDDIVTAVAAHPYPRSTIKKHFKQFKLSK